MESNPIRQNNFKIYHDPEVRMVDLLIAGGGPATLGLLCRAEKTNNLNELVCSKDGQNPGIAILEKS